MKLILSIFFLFISSCATTTNNNYDGFDSAHHACYSYIKGYNGVEKNYSKALKWCEIGSKKEKNNSSTTLLAELYYLGNGVEKNIPKASELYIKAASEWHPHAQMMVYYIYSVKYPELSSDSQKETSLKYLKYSARKGNKQAIKLLSKYNKSLKQDK